MVRRKTDNRQQITPSSQPLYSTQTMDPALIERLVRETVSNLNLYSATSTPSSLASPTSSVSRALETSDLANALTGAGACAECSKLTAPQKLSVLRKRSSVGILSDDGCRFCGLASKPESFTKPFCDFLTENPTIFHAVGYFKDKLNAAGFTEVGMLVTRNLIVYESPETLTVLFVHSCRLAKTGPIRSSPAASITPPEMAAA